MAGVGSSVVVPRVALLANQRRYREVVTNPAPASGDEFALHGGRRSHLRNRAILLLVIAGIAIAVLVNALQQAKSDNAGSVGHLVVPAATALACLGATFVTLSQWWEAETFLRVDGGRLGIRQGTRGGRGSTTWFERTEPLAITSEGVGANQGLFAQQGEARIRLGDVEAVPPLQLVNLESWIRGQGFKVERH